LLYLPLSHSIRLQQGAKQSAEQLNSESSLSSTSGRSESSPCQGNSSQGKGDCVQQMKHPLLCMEGEARQVRMSASAVARMLRYGAPAVADKEQETSEQD